MNISKIEEELFDFKNEINRLLNDNVISFICHQYWNEKIDTILWDLFVFNELD